MNRKDQLLEMAMRGEPVVIRQRESIRRLSPLALWWHRFTIKRPWLMRRLGYKRVRDYKDESGNIFKDCWVKFE